MPDVAFKAIFGASTSLTPSSPRARKSQVPSLQHVVSCIQHHTRTTETGRNLTHLRQEAQAVTQQQSLRFLQRLSAVCTAAQDELLHQYPELQNSKGVLHAQLRSLLPVRTIERCLALALWACGRVMLALSATTQPHAQIEGIANTPEAARRQFGEAVSALTSIGVSVVLVQRAWGVATDRLLTDYVRERFGRKDVQHAVLETLEGDIHGVFHPFLDAVAHSNGYARLVDAALMRQDSFGLDLLKKAAGEKLGMIRVAQLWDAVSSSATDDLSAGVMEDLKVYLSTPNARSVASTLFCANVRTAYLHPARATTDVLAAYMRLIQVFKRIDPSAVVLRRVAEPIRAFLRLRTDAVRIILNSLLEPVQPGLAVRPSTETFCKPIAEAIQRQATTGGEFREFYEGSDLKDLKWVPEPVDAVSGHQAARHLDAIAHLVSLEPKEVFIKDLETVLAERLLRSSFPTPALENAHERTDLSRPSKDLTPEIRLLEFFKQRFVELQIQTCEIMLRDVIESQRLNTTLGSQASAKQTVTQSSNDDPMQEDEPSNTQNLTSRAADDDSALHFTALVLSQHYWPSLLTAPSTDDDDDAETRPPAQQSPYMDDEDLSESPFLLPASILAAASAYDARFRAAKPRRRLAWLTAHGSAQVNLELSDRVVELACSPAEAAVIHYFGDDSASSRRTPARKSPKECTVTEIAEALHMAPRLVLASCRFWSQHDVLHRPDPQNAPESYAVLEALPAAAATVPTTTPTSTAVGQSPRPQHSSESTAERDQLAIHASLYANYVLGLLGTQGAMPTARLAETLRAAVPGGFPFEEVELEEGLLEGLVRDGRVLHGEGGWTVIK